MRKVLGFVLVLGLMAAPALADWPHPPKWNNGIFDPLSDLDSYGAASWVEFDTPSDALTADDFLCTVSGPITDIEFWGFSYYGSQYIDKFRITIWNDVPEQPGVDESHPGTLLYDYQVEPAVGGIGWQELDSGHFKINLPEDQWFYQTGSHEDPEVYWIGIQGVMVTDGYSDSFYWNFKNHLYPTWGDDAAFTSDYFGYLPWYNWGWQDDTNTANLYEGPFPDGWFGSLDMAFIITGIPEPASLVLLALGGLTLIRRR